MADGGERRRYPTDLELHRVHDRYLIDVVEALSLCPFASRARDQGEVVRVLVRLDDWRDRPVTATGSVPWHGPTIVHRRGDPSPEEVARFLSDVAVLRPRAAVFLLTFILPDGHPWHDRYAFDRMMQRTSLQHRRRDPQRRFYMACFHPVMPTSEGLWPATAANLVHRIRRSPDPVIQAVRADVMDQLRADHRKVARGRMRADLESLPAEIAHIIAHNPEAVESLSDAIDRNNFARVGPRGHEHALLLERLEQIHADRRALGQV
ncbi:MAG: hypothetical protein CMH57_06225 [Myxococcales bacterium]|nr:hypothetical protein [Myxococcales bacterium]